MYKEFYLKKNKNSPLFNFFELFQKIFFLPSFRATNSTELKLKKFCFKDKNVQRILLKKKKINK